MIVIALRDLCRPDCKRCTSHLDRCDKPVTAPCQSFNVSRSLSRIAQRIPETPDGAVEALVELDKSVGWPDAVLEFIAGDDPTRLFEQNAEDLEGLVLESDTRAVFAELTRLPIQLKGAETHLVRSWMLLSHGPLPRHWRQSITTKSLPSWEIRLRFMCLARETSFRT
jgi:hypothetical protein